MSVSVLLRLHEGELACGRVVGRAEAVETGTETTIRSLDELAAFLQRLAGGGGKPGAPRREVRS